MRIVGYEETPNPNAIKCLADSVLSPVPASFRTAEAAAGHPLAEALFAVPGVTNVFILNNWLTIGRVPGKPWGPIKKAVERAIRQAGSP